MSSKMLQFVKTEKQMPEKRTAAERAKDFDEIYADFSKAKAEEQASRCSQCGVPFPLHESFHNWTTIMTYFFEMIKWQPVAAEVSEKIFKKIVPFWY